VLDLASVGDQACAGLDSGKVSVHSLETLVRSNNLSGHTGPVTGVVASLTGNSTIYTCSQDQTVRLWDLRKPGGSVAIMKDTSVSTIEDAKLKKSKKRSTGEK